MKFYSTLLLAGALLATSCSKPADTPEAKKIKLEELLKDQSRLAADIAALRSELKVGSVGGVDTSAARKMKAVTVLTVAPETFAHYIEVQGSVESDNVVQANAEMPGILNKVLVKEGDKVAKGQVLATMDNAVLQSSVSELNTQLELANTVFVKQKALWDQKIGTEIQYLNAKTQKEGLDRKLATLRRQVGQNRILAPISGTVDMVTARDGGAASPGMPLFRLVNLSDLKIVAKVSESYLQYLKKGNNVEIALPGNESKKLLGTISYVGEVVDPGSRTVEVQVKLSSATDALRPNQTASVRINDRTMKMVIVIDENVVQNNDMGQIVYVASSENGKRIARAKKVKTGLSYNGRVQIENGLAVGDQLITQGYQDLSDGQTIQ
jgi:membrane fusion protein, multidrug efflux system